MRVSIPFKRESVFKALAIELIRCHRDTGFQFPSNGKVYSKKTILDHSGRMTVRCFNSLQTGKCIQRGIRKNTKTSKPNKFQFPSNGKVYSKSNLRTIFSTSRSGFNSLQTGKCIQSLRHSHPKNRSLICFNSLQTGKCIQSHQKSLQLRVSVAVSIPFKRESVFKDAFRLHALCRRPHVSIPFKRESVFKVLT